MPYLPARYLAPLVSTRSLVMWAVSLMMLEAKTLPADWYQTYSTLRYYRDVSEEPKALTGSTRDTCTSSGDAIHIHTH